MAAVPETATGCLNCGRELPAPYWNTDVPVPCPHCKTKVYAAVFPALFREDEGKAGETVMGDEASCFYHPTKKAVRACDGCGRFLCALCDIEMDGRHICTQCVESGARKGKIKRLKRNTFRYDDLAVAMAIVPFLFWPVTLITAPAAIFVVIWGWRKPMGPVSRSRARFVAAFLLAALQVAGWAAFFIVTLNG